MGFFSGMKAKAEARRYDKAEAMKTEKLKLDAQKEEVMKEKEYYKSKNALSQAKKEAFQERLKPVTEKFDNIKGRLQEAKKTRAKNLKVVRGKGQRQEKPKEWGLELGPGINSSGRGSEAYNLGRGLDTTPSGNNPFGLGPEKKKKEERNKSIFER